MKSKRVVLDTNVLVSALRSRRGSAFKTLSLVGTGQFETCVSIPLVFEYEDVLAREEIGIAAESAQDILDYLCHVSVRQDVFFLWRPFLKDPKDDHVLELAVASQSSDIITYNLKDFSGIERFGIRAILPAEFLSHIGVEL